MRMQKIDSDAFPIRHVIDENFDLYMIIPVSKFEQYEADDRFLNYASIVGENLLISRKSKAKNIMVLGGLPSDISQEYYESLIALPAATQSVATND